MYTFTNHILHILQTLTLEVYTENVIRFNPYNIVWRI